MSSQEISSEEVHSEDRKTSNTSNPDCCCICQDELEADGKNVRTLDCKHQFHEDCIAQWIKMRNLCPVCRAVADKSQPVKELDTDDSLSRQAIERLLRGGSRNRQSAMFWTMVLGDMFNGLLDIQGHSHGNLHRNLHETQSSIPSTPFSRYITSIPSTPFSPYITSEPSRPSSNPQVQFTSIEFGPNGMRQVSSAGSSSSSGSSGGFFGDNFPGVSLGFGGGMEDHYAVPEIPPRVREEHKDRDGECEAVQCAHCLKIVCKHDIKRCSACHQTRYCGVECQRMDWPNHHLWCKEHRSSQ